MGLVKCVSAFSQGGYSARVGDIIDTSSYLYTKSPSSFSAEDVELDTLVAGAPTSAYTQTYSTAAKTVPAAVDDLVLTATNIAAATASGTLTDAVNTNAGTVATSLDQAQKDLGAKINAINADVLALKKVVTAIIDDLQTLGLVG